MTMPDPIVRKLTLNRFRSVLAASIDFENPVFVVGRNGSGKSNLVDAFAFVAEAMESPLQAVIDKRGGTAAVVYRSSAKGGRRGHLEIGIRVGRINGAVSSASYAFSLKTVRGYGYRVHREQCTVRTAHGGFDWFDRIDDGFRTSVGGLSPAIEPAALVLPLIGGDARFAPLVRVLSAMRVVSIEPGRLREMQDPDSGMRLKRDGSNAASVLQEIERQSPEDAKRVCEMLGTIVPTTTKVLAKQQGNKLSMEFTQSWKKGKGIPFDAFSMSDGTLRALGLLTAVYQRPSPSLLVIEEPEATIHPGAMGAVLDLLRHAGHSMQLVVTTHSPEVLDAKWIEDRHLRVVEWHQGATSVAGVSSATRDALREHIMGAGELLRSNALDGDPDVLFRNPADLTAPSLFEELGLAGAS